MPPTDGMAGSIHGVTGGGTYPGPHLTANDGTPDDPFAWFNQVPAYLGERSLSLYYHDPGADTDRLPFPNNKGKIWECPSATMSDADLAIVKGANGPSKGFFSYVMNIDLKRQTPDYGTKDSYTYPGMPKLSTLHRPTDTVFMFDTVFNPTTEIVNGSPQFNSVNPANRWVSMASRHTKGGIINFIDGHADYWKTAAVQAGGTPGGSGSTAEFPGSPLIWNPAFRNVKP
jgi:hypothetical protein